MKRIVDTIVFLSHLECIQQNCKKLFLKRARQFEICRLTVRFFCFDFGLCSISSYAKYEEIRMTWKTDLTDEGNEKQKCGVAITRLFFAMMHIHAKLP